MNMKMVENFIKEQPTGYRFTTGEISAVLDISRTAAGRLLRQMQRLGKVKYLSSIRRWEYRRSDKGVTVADLLEVSRRHGEVKVIK